MNTVFLPMTSLIGALLASHSAVRYEISFDNAIHHEAQISATFSDISTEILELRMSRSSPGRYAIHEFGKNVYAVSAVDGAGRSLPIHRPNPYQWDVAGHDGTVSVTYTLYADRAGGTYSGIDGSHAHLNMPATFIWARGFDNRPIEIIFDIPDESWKIATQLVPTDMPRRFTAPHLQYFLDSPTELSDFSLREWPVISNDKTYTIRLAVHHRGTEDNIDKYTEMVKLIVEEQKAVFGDLPDFDYGTYTFIADYLPYVSGDGMEHRNSTIVTNTDDLETDDYRQIGTISHEFFHAWNVERIRPHGLEPFDFEQANMSENLWFAEGFTSYYGGLILRRTGKTAVDEYAESLANRINTVTFAPGRAYFSPIGMSMRAPFRDAATSIDPTNFKNTFISYYTYGSALALALDLTLLSEFEDLSLDDYMRAVWLKYGKPEVPYTVNDLEEVLADLTNTAFASNFFNRYILGQELPDYQTLLAQAGFLLRQKTTTDVYVDDVPFDVENRQLTIAEATTIGSPLYRAGLDSGDWIKRIDHRKIKSERGLKRVLKRYKPNDTAVIEYEQRGRTLNATITFEADPRLEVVLYEDADMEVSTAMQTLRDRWLGAKRQ